MDKPPANAARKRLMDVLALSARISRHAPPLKPFLRFSKSAAALYQGSSNRRKRFFWDFDDALQRVLVGVARQGATSGEMADACTERWKTNLEKFGQKSRQQLEDWRTKGEARRFPCTPRDEFLFARVKPGGRLLYVGCGVGTECLGWAQRGYEVVGIDTDEHLVAVANEWAEYLKLPFQAVCMDAARITLPPESFDGLLLEFYGFQPSRGQALALQRSLAPMLNDQGQGFIAAPRKKYASYWYKMTNLGYPDPLCRWLVRQQPLDHCFSTVDACEEKLAFGLYIRTHTVDSLTRELGDVFDVRECRYEETDPRYLIGVVKKKGHSPDSSAFLKAEAGEEWDPPGIRRSSVLVEEVLRGIQVLCDLLEAHQERVVAWFLTGGGNPLSMEAPELPRVIEMLEPICEQWPLGDGP